MITSPLIFNTNKQTSLLSKSRVSNRNSYHNDKEAHERTHNASVYRNTPSPTNHARHRSEKGKRIDCWEIEFNTVSRIEVGEVVYGSDEAVVRK